MLEQQDSSSEKIITPEGPLGVLTLLSRGWGDVLTPTTELLRYSFLMLKNVVDVVGERPKINPQIIATAIEELRPYLTSFDVENIRTVKESWGKEKKRAAQRMIEKLSLLPDGGFIVPGPDAFSKNLPVAQKDLPALVEMLKQRGFSIPFSSEEDFRRYIEDNPWGIVLFKNNSEGKIEGALLVLDTEKGIAAVDLVFLRENYRDQFAELIEQRLMWEIQESFLEQAEGIAVARKWQEWWNQLPPFFRQIFENSSGGTEDLLKNYWLMLAFAEKVIPNNFSPLARLNSVFALPSINYKGKEYASFWILNLAAENFFLPPEMRERVEKTLQFISRREELSQKDPLTQLGLPSPAVIESNPYKFYHTLRNIRNIYQEEARADKELKELFKALKIDPNEFEEFLRNVETAIVNCLGDNQDYRVHSQNIFTLAGVLYCFLKGGYIHLEDPGLGVLVEELITFEASVPDKDKFKMLSSSILNLLQTSFNKGKQNNSQ